MSHIENAFAILDEAQLLMEEKRQSLKLALRAAQQSDFHLDMLLGGFHLGCATTSAVKVLLASGNELLHPAISCSRAFFELSSRLHWASREKYGWYRLHAWFVAEEIKWAKLVQPIPELRLYADKILRTRESYAGRKASDGTEITCAPNFEQTIKDLEKYREPAGFAGTYSPGFEYNVVYRQLCQFVHGHMGVILDSKPNRFRHWAVVVPLKATFAMVHAYHQINENSDDEFKSDMVRLLYAYCRISSL